MYLHATGDFFFFVLLNFVSFIWPTIFTYYIFLNLTYSEDRKKKNRILIRKNTSNRRFTVFTFAYKGRK